ncbi:serine/threonine protein kinase [Nodularia spumigena CENA596]|uniref:Serine/threonine protein kinase n=1 Tax=Nodularia spumigena CENA596 TaxID=1819295 RepID=A0A161UWG4_NODSP|nr:protein kinase [Nodularia spumigena]KZL50423.1 serine/threonine protein kinase [Nodularia spumigena CENA596]
MQAKITLTITEGSLKGQEFIFDSRTTCLIGRSPDCKPKLPDDEAHRTISRYHCLLDINPPDIRVRDFGSRNGTFVNGTKIGQRQPEQTPEEGAKLTFPEYDLKTNDAIQLGDTVFQVSIERVSEVEANKPGLNVASVGKTEPSENVQQLLQQAHAGNSDLLSIQGYSILRELGRGGFGAVFLAHHNETGEEVALKVMLPAVATNPQMTERFLREINNTQALNHPNIIKLLNSGYYNGTFFFTLEYCDGGTVDDLMKRSGGKLSIDEATSIIMQVLEGLSYAHQAEIPYVKLADGSFGRGRGLVHRDLKPCNIFITHTNGDRTIKIADYGLAKAFDQAGLSGQTMSGTKAGTPVFMPRQQLINFKYAKPEVDIWATAACLYFMLTGAYPRKVVGDPFLAVLQTNAVPIREYDASIPKQLAELIDQALVDKPEIYFKNAASFKHALSGVL